MNRGNAWYTKGELDRAIADYDLAIAFDPYSAKAHYNRGVAELVQGLLDSAIADFDEAIKLKPGHAPTYLSRGIARFLKGNDVEGEKDLEEFRTLGGTLTEALKRAIDEARSVSGSPGTSSKR